jgi:hypothetical protein
MPAPTMAIFNGVSYSSTRGLKPSFGPSLWLPFVRGTDPFTTDLIVSMVSRRDGSRRQVNQGAALKPKLDKTERKKGGIEGGDVQE